MTRYKGSALEQYNLRRKPAKTSKYVMGRIRSEIIKEERDKEPEIKKKLKPSERLLVPGKKQKCIVPVKSHDRRCPKKSFVETISSIVDDIL